MTVETEVTLPQILDARERRVERQRRLLEQYGKTLVCFTMNIAGPVKNNDLIRWGFQFGGRMLIAQVTAEGIRVLCHQEYLENTGCEGYWVLDGEPEKVKALTVQVEDSIPLGRLFDMDVLAMSGEKLQREDLGFPRRRCLLCQKEAVVCGRSRAHSVPELQAKTVELLVAAMRQERSREIAQLACRSLLYEVCVTPKPGLVDRSNSGSHRDMDIFSFMSSGSTLWPYFQDCALCGMETASETPEETFRRLRFLGRCAERDMLNATGGVNTHKGAVFTMGILCGAAGRLGWKESLRSERLLEEAAAMARGLVRQDLSDAEENRAVTQGRRLYAQFGIAGIRGEAEAGFPTVSQAGLPVLTEGIRRGLSVNDAACAALLAIMASAADTNLISRSSLERQQRVREEIKTVLAENPYPDRTVLEKLDAAFIEENLSPGGSADLLAASLFLYFLCCET